MSEADTGGYAVTAEEGLTNAQGVTVGAESTNHVQLGTAVPPEVTAHRHAFGGLLSRGAADDHHEHEVPPAVRRYLVAGEEHATGFPLHPCAMGRADLVLVGGLAAAITLHVWAYAHGLAHPAVVRLIWIAFTIAAGWWAWQLAVVRSTWIVVTPKRIMTVVRFPTAKVTSLPWRRARDVELSQNVTGRLFGYGTLQLLSIGTDHALAQIRWVPRAERVYRIIWGILQPAKGPSPMPEDAW
jgi:PH (Pleckstrin Homology) domain-containing protein